MPHELIPLSMLNAFVYCPRRFFYEYIEGSMVYNADVEDGRIKHEKLDNEEGKTSKKRSDFIHTRSLYLSSDRYGITGKIDLVEESEGTAYPVEYKKRKAPKDSDDKPFVWLNDQIQLCSHALLLEDKGKARTLYYIWAGSNANPSFLAASLSFESRQTK